MSKLLKKFCGIFGYKLFKKDYIKSKTSGFDYDTKKFAG